MKLTKIEISLIAAAAVIAMITVGYFLGRTRSEGRIVVETENTPAAQKAETESEAQEPETEAEEKDAGTEKVNINTATAEELTELPGIGEVIAGRIVEYREEYGDFAFIEEIMSVKGIGDAVFKDIQNLITLGD